MVPGGCVPGAARSGTPQPKPTPDPLQVRNELAAPALGAPKLLIFLLLPTLNARTVASQLHFSVADGPGLPLGVSFAWQLATFDAEAVEADPRAMMPRTPAAETRTAIRRMPRQPRSDRDVLIT